MFRMGNILLQHNITMEFSLIISFLSFPGGVALLQITRITIKSHHLHLITDSFSILHVFRSVRLLLHVFTTNSHNFTQIYEDSPIVRKIPQVYEKSEGIAHFYEKSERFPCFTLIVYKKF